jgi:rRNA maturation protein Rpf1
MIPVYDFFRKKDQTKVQFWLSKDKGVEQIKVEHPNSEHNFQVGRINFSKTSTEANFLQKELH